MIREDSLTNCDPYPHDHQVPNIVSREDILTNCDPYPHDHQVPNIASRESWQQLQLIDLIYFPTSTNPWPRNSNALTDLPTKSMPVAAIFDIFGLLSLIFFCHVPTLRLLV
jgi:hypothetical protein